MSAPDNYKAPIMGMELDPARYGAANVNIPLQPQELPVTQQTAIMPYTTGIPGVPPGLEYLNQIDQVVVNEKFYSTQRMSRNYEMLNNVGQRIYFAKQEVACCGSRYNIHVFDNANMEVMQFIQHCCSCSCSLSSEVEIHCPPGTIIGYCIWNWSSYVTSLSIQNNAKQTILVVVGPGFQNSVFGDVNFEVKSNDETHIVGMIRREGGHLFVQFPLDLDAKVKAVLLGSTLFMDHIIYQKRSEMLTPKSSD